MHIRYYLLFLIVGLPYAGVNAQSGLIAKDGWASNSINTVIFRKNALVTAGGYQYAAYYDTAQTIILAKRRTGSLNWTIRHTHYKGDAADAHKSISIMVDGRNYLHMVWGQHNNQLNYVKSLKPGSLNLTDKLEMTGSKEQKLSYPEFYKISDGNLIFLYRDGGSGNGDLVMNRYNTALQKWVKVQDNLIDGQGQRSPYWQMAVDTRGAIHLSWVWRETPDVASNHDMAYACSNDGGRTWHTSTGKKYALPITAQSAEYAVHIPQKSELINQTAMFADAQSHPFIATYWRDSDQAVPQYHIVYNIGSGWKVSNLGFRKSPFSLSGGGTKQIPVSRPQIVAWQNTTALSAALIFRDEELSNKVSVAVCNDIFVNTWIVINLSDYPVGSWEPTYDTELWKEKQVLDLFIQNNIQVDGEGKTTMPPQPIKVLEWRPNKKII